MQIHISPRPTACRSTLQIVNQVKYLVAAGRLAPGEEFPPIRVLAERLLVNPNTVARAYRELELAGVVEKRRTSGTYVSDAGSPLARRERLRSSPSGSMPSWPRHGRWTFGLDEVIELVRERDEVMQCSMRRGLSHDGHEGNLDTMSMPIFSRALRRGRGRQHHAAVRPTLALDGVSLRRAPRASVFGLIGENGAGKTTLIKHVLGLLKAQSGRSASSGSTRSPIRSASSPRRLPVEDRDLPDWMRMAS